LASLPLTLHTNFLPVQWGKLLLNLNNPVNALSGQPLKAELLDRGYRQVLASLIDEALQILQQANIQPAKVGAVAPAWLPALLRLPTPVFRLLASRMLRMDDKARSSMADDLAMGRPTEIDALCGEVVRLAKAQGQSAPLNSAISALVHRWPEQPKLLAPQALLSALGLAS
jgi:2-dehydropantoate 2-reductase